MASTAMQIEDRYDPNLRLTISQSVCGVMEVLAGDRVQKLAKRDDLQSCFSDSVIRVYHRNLVIGSLLLGVRCRYECAVQWRPFFFEATQVGKPRRGFHFQMEARDSAHADEDILEFLHLFRLLFDESFQGFLLHPCVAGKKK